MIRNVGGQSGTNVYNNNTGGAGKSEKSTSSSTESKASSKLESLKEAIDNGEYRVDLEALAKKMAEDLSQG